MSIQFHPQARDDFRAAMLYYREVSAGMQRDYYAAVQDALQRIDGAPRMWPIFDSGMRRCLVQKFPYSIVYECSESGLVIVYAVAHLRRAPGYWHERL